MDRDELNAFWNDAKQVDFTATHDEAISEVTTWAWSAGPTHWLLPLGRELASEVGRSLKGEPKKLREGHYAYGFDAQHRLRLIRQIVDLGGNRPLGDWVTIITTGPDELRWIEYGALPGRRVRHAVRVVLEQGQAVAFHQVTNSSYLRLQYLRDEEGRIVTIEEDNVVSWRAKRRSRRHETHRVFHVTHDARGLLGIDVVSGRQTKYTHAAYRRPVEGTLEQLATELEELLVTEVPARASRLGLGEPAYDLALVWNDAGRVLPPAVAVGVASERTRLAPEGLERAPCEKACFASGPFDFDTTGSRIMDLSLTLESILPWDNRIALLQRVARRLAALDWRSHLPVTEDFQVYACDMWGDTAGS
jgi:hypothetical protein